MTITFTALESTHETAAGTHRRSLRRFGVTDGIGGGSGVHRRRLRSHGITYGSSIDDGDPEIPAMGTHSRILTTTGSGAFYSHFDEGNHWRRMSHVGYATADHGATYDANGVHRRRLRSFGYDIGDAQAGHGLLVAMPFYVSGFGSVFFENMVEVVGAGSALSNLPIYGVVERLRMGAVPDTTFTGLARASDRIEFGDALSVVIRELLAEGFSLSGEASANFAAVVRVIDALRFSGLASSSLQATNIVVAAIAFGELVNTIDVQTLSDEVAFADAAADVVRAVMRLVDQLLVSGEASPAVSMGVLVSDSVALGSEVSSTAQLVELLQEGVSFALHLNIDDGSYVAYSINTESKQATQYTNYAFNSFAKFGGRYFGMTPDGIRELEGPDDAGSPIAARFRMAMSTLGTTQMKRMVAAYLGYTSTGELRVKTITVDQHGVKSANWYRLHAQVADEPREARVKIGQGLRSVYWGFEVEAIDGAAFHIDLLDLQPIAVTQRLQGQNGGKR